MARKLFYLLKRRDALTHGKPTYYCRFRDESGKLMAWRSTGQSSKTRAENWALAKLEERKIAKPGADTTLQVFAADFYVAGKCSYLKRQAAKGRPVSKPWARAKRQLLVNHVFPALGKCRLCELTRPLIERLVVDLPLSNQTRNHLLYALRTVLAEAEAEGLIARNPLEHAEPLGKKARKRDIFSIQELRRLFPSTREGLLGIWGQPKYMVLYLTLATTGIRQGEARALRWRDVLPKGWLAIERAVKQSGEIGAPKSGDVRVTAIPARTQEALSWWYDESPFTETDDLVFYGESARKPLSRRVFDDILNRAYKKTGITAGERFLTTHSFRHTYNTMMRRSIPADALRALVGHKGESMTNYYDHPGIADLVKSLTGVRPQIEAAIEW